MLLQRLYYSCTYKRTIKCEYSFQLYRESKKIKHMHHLFNHFILHNYELKHISRRINFVGCSIDIDTVIVFVYVIVIVFAYFKANQFEGCSTTCNQSVLELPVTLEMFLLQRVSKARLHADC